MSQFSFSIPNQPGANFRADTNSGLQALATLSSGSTAPTTTYAYQFWADTSTTPATLRQRNGANNAWVVVGSLDTTNWGFAPAASPTFTGTVTLPTVTVSGNMTFSGTGYLDLPVGTTAQRPGSPSAGMLRYNSTTNQFEGYGAAWGPVTNPTDSIRNRIINGDMRIDQRYAGAASGTAINGYVVDRWQVIQSSTGKLNSGRNFNSITPPTGFTNYFGVQSQSAYSVAASDYYTITQVVEGLNIADLAWGTASASSVTLSFRVYSSLTGTFGGSLKNGAQNRSYPFTYSIPTANTWTTVSIVIPGDTTGTWTTDNTAGIYLSFGLGAGSTYSGTAGAWAGSNLVSATGAVSVVGTNAATFYITGVQLEAGSLVTPFERRSYGLELMLSQRYFVANALAYLQGYIASGGSLGVSVNFPVAMRTSPTCTETATSNSNVSTTQFQVTGPQAAAVYAAGINIGVATLSSTFRASAEL